MRHVLICTEHRGVFFGSLMEQSADGRVVTLSDAQMCVYWSSDCHGAMGLAATGPTAGCRIGPPVPTLTLQAVTCIADCTDEAVKAWKAQPWAT